MLDIIYPPLCLYCNEYLEKGKKIFCLNCLEYLILIDPFTRCSKCFMDIGCNCCKKANPFRAVASAVQYNKISMTLISKMKYCGHFYLAGAIAAIMARQFIQLDWPKPDLVTFIPMNFSKFMKRGFNQSAQIAKYFCKIMKFKYKKILVKTHYSPSQALLGLNDRKTTNLKFKPLNSLLDLTDKNVLLIDDVMTTQMTLFRAGYSIKQLNCKRLYALTFCRTELESLIQN